MAVETTPATTATSDGTGTPAAVTPEAKAAAEAAATAAAAKATSDAAAAAEAAKAGDGKAGAESGNKDGKTPVESKAPDKYELKVPDAGKAYLEDADLKYLEEAARANGWTNDEAQAALEEHLSTVQAQSARFEAATKADKTYGGDQFEETKRLARSVIDKIRPAGHERRDSFLAFMGRGGAGNHVEVLSFLADLGRQMGEDSPVHSRGGGTREKADTASKMYDHPDSRALDK